MKRRFLAVILGCIVPLIGFTQKPETSSAEIPVDEVTKLISFAQVVPVDNVAMDEMFKRAGNWFREFYTNPTDVIRSSDAAVGKITGKHRFKIFNEEDKKGFKTEAGLVNYTINVSIRDGRYKCEVTELNLKQSSFYAAEKWLEKEAPGYQKVYAYYLSQCDENVKQIMASLEKAMKTVPPKNNKDDW
jgi:hypothetical protein